MFSNSPLHNQQKISKKPVRAGICNEDLAYGNYVAVPREVLDLVASGKMPLAKFKLLALLLKNNANFHVKYQYLANRMVPRTIAKYIPELIEDGYIYVEKDHNGLVHHDINPIHFWKPLQHIVFDDLENYQGRFRVGMADSKFRINDMTVEAKRKVYCAPIWNAFIEEWANGHISNSAFRLFIAIATVSDRLHVKREYLTRCGFDSRTIKKARIELEQGGYIWTDITKKGVIWNMNRIAEWNIFKGKVNLPIVASVSPLQDNTHDGTPSDHAVAELDGAPSDHAVAELDVAELDVAEPDHNNTPANKTLGKKNRKEAPPMEQVTGGCQTGAMHPSPSPSKGVEARKEQNDSTPNATRNKTFSVNQEQNVLGNQEHFVPGDKTSRENEKDKTKDDDRAIVDTTSDVGQSSTMHPSPSPSPSRGLEARNLVEEYGSFKRNDPPQTSPARPKVFAPSEKDVRAARARENTLGVGNPLSVNYTAIKSEFRRLLSAKVDGGSRWGELLNLVFREADALPLVKREHYLSATIHIIEKENQNYRSVNPHFQKMQGDLLLEDFKGKKFIHKKAMGAVNKG